MSVSALRALDWAWHRTAPGEEMLGSPTGTQFYLLGRGLEPSTGCGRSAFTFLFCQWDSSPHIFQDRQEEILTTDLCAGWRTGSPSLRGSFKDLEEERNREKENIYACVCVCVWCVPIKSTICLTDNIYLSKTSIFISHFLLSPLISVVKARGKSIWIQFCLHEGSHSRTSHFPGKWYNHLFFWRGSKGVCVKTTCQSHSTLLGITRRKEIWGFLT